MHCTNFDLLCSNLLAFLSCTLYTIYSRLISRGKFSSFLNHENYNLLSIKFYVPYKVGQPGFSVPGCGHGSRMTQKVTLDKCGVYFKLSAKSRAEFTA